MVHEINLTQTDNAEKETTIISEENSESQGNQQEQADSCKAKKLQSYDRLPEEDKQKIKSILYIMDKFSVSQEAYHELTQHDRSLPRSYLVKGCQQSLDDVWKVTRTPGECPGAELPFKELLEIELRKQLSKSSADETTVKVKISGDGARMSHSSSLFVCSFSLLEEGQQMLSSSGNHTIALVKGHEEYGPLKEGLKNVCHSVNQLVEKGYIEIDGKKVNLHFHLGGDYKFLLLALGMKGATSNNSCIWCLIHKNNRCDMSVPHGHYNSNQMKRKFGPNWTRAPGCQNQPLFNIPLEDIVLDELHLMLRVTDRLEKGLILEVIDWDQAENYGKPASQHRQAHLDAFLDTARSLGVSLNVWKSAETKKYEWTSLLGREKRILLRKLPEQFGKILPTGRVPQVQRLWNGFSEVLDLINKEKHTDQDIKDLQEKAKDWASLMVNMSGSGAGYLHETIITPYMHALVFHVPTMIEMHGSLKYFSGQGVEKKNDDFRRYFHRKINRWDACNSLLLVEKRQEMLQDYERQPRKYFKKDNAFWLHGGKQEVARKYPRISVDKTQAPQEPETVPQHTETGKKVLNQSAGELRKLKIAELVILLTEIVGYQPELPKKPRKPELLSKILDIAVPRGE
ncbi:uncharacterized protein LOC144632757 [Oculina patagonica]